jgi:hypothetical protein
MKRFVAVPLLLALAAPATAAPELRVRDHLDWKGAGFPGTVRVRCGPWSADASDPAIHVDVGSRNRHWELSAVLADVQEHPTVRFPHSFVFDEPNGAELFAATPHHEVSSAEEEARGRITFTKASCGENLRLAFRIDAKLGSEFSDGRPLRVKGSFSARLVGS